MSELKEYLDGKAFYSYGEDTEVFLAESKDQLYNEYLQLSDDKEDYPVVELDTEDFMKKVFASDERLSEEDIYNDDTGLYYSTVENIIKIAKEGKWKTPFQITSSYW